LPGTQPISATLCVGRSRMEYHVTSIQTIVIAYLKRLQDDEHLRMHAKHAPCIQAWIACVQRFRSALALLSLQYPTPALGTVSCRLRTWYDLCWRNRCGESVRAGGSAC
jgi:hypothetical protein